MQTRYTLEEQTLFLKANAFLLKNKFCSFIEFLLGWRKKLENLFDMKEFVFWKFFSIDPYYSYALYLPSCIAPSLTTIIQFYLEEMFSYAHSYVYKFLFNIFVLRNQNSLMMIAINWSFEVLLKLFRFCAPSWKYTKFGQFII